MILSNTSPLFWSSTICVTHLCLIKVHQATTGETALLSVSMQLHQRPEWWETDDLMWWYHFATKVLNTLCVCDSRFLRFGAHQWIWLSSHYSIFHQVGDSCCFWITPGKSQPSVPQYSRALLCPQSVIQLQVSQPAFIATAEKKLTMNKKCLALCLH